MFNVLLKTIFNIGRYNCILFYFSFLYNRTHIIINISIIIESVECEIQKIIFVVYCYINFL